MNNTSEDIADLKKENALLKQALEGAVAALKRSEDAIVQLCERVNSFSVQLGLGENVKAEEWLHLQRLVLEKAKDRK